MKPVHRLAALAAAVAVGLLGAPVLADPSTDCPAGPLACATDVAAALDIERRSNDNFHYGQMLEIDYRTAEQIPGDVASAGAWGDSGLWTGVYLGGQSFRYATARYHLANQGQLTQEQVDYWLTQYDQSRARVKEIVDKYHLLANIGRGWRTGELDPTGLLGEPPDFGGGVFDGEEGLLMRGCSPTDAPPSIGIGQNKRVFGPFPWEDGKQYMCETAPSRDTYAGTIFGLLLAYDLVGPDEPFMRAQIRRDVLTLADRLVRYAWNFPRPHGHISHPAPKPIPGGGGHDFDNFISPLFVYVPLARLSLVQAARHVASEGSSDEQLYWQAVWLEELATQGPILAGSMEVDAIQPNEGYYKYNLNHLNMSTLIRLEREEPQSTLFRQALSVMDHTTRDDINAHFEAITYSLTGQPGRLNDAVTHLRQWLDYRHNIHQGPVDNAPGCGTGFQCVPNDQLDIDVQGAVVSVPGTSTKLRAATPLPVADRAPTDFLWQRPPTQLAGSESPRHQAPGIDFLTPYWMIRYYTEAAPPALAPLPGWIGPAHR